MQAALVTLSLAATALSILLARTHFRLMEHAERLNKLVAELAGVASFYEATLQRLGYRTVMVQKVLDENDAEIVGQEKPN